MICTQKFRVAAAVLKLLPLNRQNLRLVFSNRCWACFFNDCYEALLQQQIACLQLPSSVLVIRVHKGQNMTYLTRNQSYDWSSLWKLSTPIRSVSYEQRPPGWRANPSAASGTSAREVNSHDEYSLFALYPRAPKKTQKSIN